MRKVYFHSITGSIGQEVFHIKVFLYYVDYLRSNNIEPTLVFTGKPHNKALCILIKRKLNNMRVKYCDLSNNKLFSVFYNRVIMRKTFKFDCNGMAIGHQIGSTKRYLDYVIHSGCKYAEAKGTYADFEAINNSNTFLAFSDEENEMAKKELKKIKINRDFVCVHARDALFYPKRKHDDMRNIRFESFLPACNYLSQSGIQTIRMGAKQVSVDKKLFNQDIIDYAGKHRADFMDIWTIANCKFFLCSDSGLFNVSYMFNKPNAIVNLSSILYAAPWTQYDIYLPQKIWVKQEKRFLTFKEIAQYDIGLDMYCWTSVRYDKEGFECIKSTPEEITDLTKEINDVLDGKYQYNEEDNYLQQKFKSIFKVYHSPYHTPARVGREFLKQNKELFL
ncbi:MAG TPA: TIGR04372 family glycosyltransferase [Candidatus Wunengus sp. YC65]|uniref:TIGR04372 family glycosyltransferase n=1 Tax=Candidatus Wunengus sp. YC65 TaxID=3367701 RepID=UPI004026FF70